MATILNSVAKTGRFISFSVPLEMLGWWHFPFLSGRKVCPLAISPLHQLWNPNAPGQTGPWRCATTTGASSPCQAHLLPSPVTHRCSHAHGFGRLFSCGGGGLVGKAGAFVSSYFLGTEWVLLFQRFLEIGPKRGSRSECPDPQILTECLGELRDL